MLPMHWLVLTLLLSCDHSDQKDPNRGDTGARASAYTDSSTPGTSGTATTTHTSLETGDTATSTTSTSLKVDVTWSEETACADPEARSAGPFETLAFEDDSQWLIRVHGAGVTVGDYQNDGRPDVFFFGSSRSDFIAQDTDGNWEVNPVGALDASTPMDMVFGGSSADYDGDGDLDVYMSRYMRPNVLLENDGSGTFTNVAEARGVTGDPTHFSGSSSWSDFDRDGDLDLFVAGHGYVREGSIPRSSFDPGNPSYLFVNDGTGHFVDRSDLLPQVFHDTYTFIGTWVDLNRDGWPDLYGINDLGNAFMPCKLLWNDGGKGFVSDENASGLDVDVAGMGLAFSDLNNDGLDDFLIPAWGRMKYMLSSPTLNMWVDYATDRGLLPNADTYNQVIGWGAEWADVDNDMDLDAMVVFGYLTTEFIQNEDHQPDGLWLQDELGDFVDVAPEWGINNIGDARGIVASDLNRDGWVDFAKPDINGPNLLQLSRCGESSWVRVQLRDETTPNTHGIGARVAVDVGENHMERTLTAGGTGYGSSLLPEAHFGLGTHEKIDRVTVTWPDGATSEVLTPPPRHTLTLTRRN
jgi:hypothetical protein